MSGMSFNPTGGGKLLAAAALGALALSVATPSFAAGRVHHRHHVGPVAAAATGVGLAAGAVLGAAANAATPGYYGESYAYNDPYAGVYGVAPAYTAAPFGAYAAGPCTCGGVAYGYGPGPAYGYAPRPAVFPTYGYAEPPFFGGPSYGYAPGPGYAYSYGYGPQPYASGRATIETSPGYVRSSRGTVRTRTVSNEAQFGYGPRVSASESGRVVEPRSSSRAARLTRVSTSAERGARADARASVRVNGARNATGQCYTSTDKDRGFGYMGECKK